MPPQKSESRDLDKVIVRLPDGMRDRLKAEAERNKRSMNAEIVARLEETFERKDWVEDLDMATIRHSEGIDAELAKAMGDAIRSVLRRHGIKTSSAEHPDGDPDEGE